MATAPPDPRLILLAEAQAALHSLRTGSAVSEIVDQNGEKVRFSVTNLGELKAYVEDLSAQLGLVARRVNRPVRFVF